MFDPIFFATYCALKLDVLCSNQDRLRQQPGSSVSLSASPLLDTSRDECSPISPISVKCDYCEEAFNCEDELQKHKAASCRKRFMCVACNVHCVDLGVREHLPKKNVFFRALPEWGGGRPLPELFLHFFINCIFGIFLHKCMFLNSELLFRLIIYVSLPSFNIFANLPLLTLLWSFSFWSFSF